MNNKVEQLVSIVNVTAKKINTCTNEKFQRKYINGHCSFDIENMVASFNDNIIYKNIQNNEINLSLNGLAEFKQQTENAITYLNNYQRTRTKTIRKTYF